MTVLESEGQVSEVESTSPLESATGLVPPEIEKVDITTEAAFLVYLDEQGHWTATSQVAATVTARREANMHDFYNAAATIQKDLASNETAQRTVYFQQQIAAQIAQHQEAQRILAATKGAGAGGVDLKAVRR